MTETLVPQFQPSASAAQADRQRAFGDLVAASHQMCTTAVDATAIAVMLEIGGVNDVIAARTYGARDVHDLAERLLRAIPTRSTALILTGEDAGGDRHASARLIRRGILYAAPGAFYVAVVTDFHSAWAGLAVIGTTATGWMASQVIGFVAYRLSERSGPANAHAVLQRAVVLTVPVALALAAAVAPAVGPVAAALLGAQVVFAAAAAVLLFYDADRVLAYCVVPGAAVAVACAFDWPAPVPPWLPPFLAATAALVTALVTAGAALTARSAGAPPVRYPGLGELAGALPYVAYGLLCAAALAFRPVLDMVRAEGDAPAPEPALAVLPVVLVMGYGELEIRRLRASCQVSASICTTMRRYRRRARAALIHLELRVALALALTTAVTTAVLWAGSGRGGLTPAELLYPVATVALGCALVTGLVGCSFARPAQTAVVFLAAFGLVAVAGLAIAPLDPRGPAGYLAACLLLLIAVDIAAARVVQNPVTVIG